MRRFVIPMAVLGAALAAQPALAQSWGNQGYGQGYGYGYGQNREYRVGDAQRIEWRVEQLARSGQLNGREVQNLRWQARNLRDIERRYSYNGYSRGELRDLDMRADRLSQQIRYAARDGRWDRDDRYDRDGRYDRDHWDRDGRGYDRYDRDDRDDDDWRR